MSMLDAILNLAVEFERNGLERPSVIRLKDKDQGMHFAYLIGKESQYKICVAHARRTRRRINHGRYERESRPRS